MKKLIILFLLLLTPPVFGFYAGVGVAWDTVDETFSSKLSTNQNRSGNDRYDAHDNRFAPVIKIGHQLYFDDCEWMAGLSLEWKYLSYKTPQNSGTGQLLPNATFSSINIFGPNVERDFSSKSRVSNELILLSYLGKRVFDGYVYLGVGPALLDAANSIYVSSVHTPNGTGDHLITTSVKDHKILWGGAAQLGYQYFLSECYFLNICYTYLQTERKQFNNTANTAVFNGFDTPGSTLLFLKREIEFTVQEFILSINWGF